MGRLHLSLKAEQSPAPLPLPPPCSAHRLRSIRNLNAEEGGGRGAFSVTVGSGALSRLATLKLECAPQFPLHWKGVSGREIVHRFMSAHWASAV